MRLQNLVALVTGSSRGIGRSIALRYAQEGADIVVNYSKDEEGGKQTVADIQKLGRKVIAIRADLAKVSEVQRLVDGAISQMGKLDILVNNAGIEKKGMVWEVTEADYDAVVDVNLKGVFFTTQEMVRHLRDTKRKGKIINISSVHEDLAFPGFTPYCAAKGGLRMLCRNLAVELGPLGITINNIAPGAIETPINTKLLNDPKLLSALLHQIPLGRLGQGEDVAGVATFLASSDADYVTGSTYYVDGGLTVHYEEQ